MHTCIHAYTHTWIHAYTCIHAYMHTRVYTYMDTRSAYITYMDTRVYMHNILNISVIIHTGSVYTYMDTRVYIHTFIIHKVLRPGLIKRYCLPPSLLYLFIYLHYSLFLHRAPVSGSYVQNVLASRMFRFTVSPFAAFSPRSGPMYVHCNCQVCPFNSPNCQFKRPNVPRRRTGGNVLRDDEQFHDNEISDELVYSVTKIKLV